MKDKLMSIFVAFVRKTFTEDRLIHLIDDLIDVVFDRFARPNEPVEECIVDQAISFVDLKEGVVGDV
jgi:hypothetical protein|nr:MAG TPA: hypothetical protein [Microviridae sp.]